MFWRFTWGAVRFRRGRLAVSFLALAVSAMLATALFSVYSDLERKLRAGFREHGANLLIAPGTGAKLVPLSAAGEAVRLGALASPVLYTVGKLRDEPVVLAGMDFARAGPLTGYWRVEGSRQAAEGECLTGSTAAAHFRLQLGDRIELEGGACTVRGIVTTGGPEDNQVLVPFEVARRIAGAGDEASVIEVRADGERLEEIRASIARVTPEADVRRIQAVAETEAAVALKLRRSLFLLFTLLLAITMLCVSSNFSELVLERSREIGVLKALGARDRGIAGLLVSEATMLALAAAVAGYALGLGVAYLIGRNLFPGAAVGVDARVLAPVAGVTVTVAVLATLFPAARLWRIEPAVTLRGE